MTTRSNDKGTLERMSRMETHIEHIKKSMDEQRVELRDFIRTADKIYTRKDEFNEFRLQTAAAMKLNDKQTDANKNKIVELAYKTTILTGLGYLLLQNMGVIG